MSNKDIIIGIVIIILISTSIGVLLESCVSRKNTYDIDIYSKNGYLLDSYESVTKLNATKNYCFFYYDGTPHTYYNCIFKIKEYKGW